ncbi:MAG TPA: glutathione transferase GstA [Burkholderiaceae bacterium]|nr:glutathione transferase GstA [Burkholderiaceae bacterium]HQR69307.1 glutathione transferase GstA [Burkholderiaceae bacterium]
MKLYYSPGACSLSPHIVAREAGLPVTLVKVDLKGKKTDTGDDYHALSGKGYVPLLELDDGTRLTEGPAIVQYLADRAPACKLAPANGTIDRYRLQEWLNFITSELHKQFSPLFDPTMPEEAKAKFRAKITGRLDWIVGQIGNHPYLMGQDFTVADAYLFTVLNWAQYTGIDLARWPLLVAYVARVAARPQVQAALTEEGLLKKAA